MSFMGGLGLGNHGIQNPLQAIQSAGISVGRETVDKRREMRETNKTQQFKILNRDIGWVDLQATQRGVAA